MLEVKNLSKSFQKNLILNDVTFSLSSGETTVILGKSGAGKSTLLRCLTGLEPFDCGEILIHQLPPRSGQIGLVFQNFNLFPHLSILENIMLPQTHILKTPPESAKTKALELLTWVDLADKADAYPCELSGGQQQRVAIARACAMNPDVLCFDEPTSALDPQTIEKIIILLQDLQSKGVSILIITHDTSFAKKIADQMLTLEQGKLSKTKIKSLEVDKA